MKTKNITIAGIIFFVGMDAGSANALTPAQAIKVQQARLILTNMKHEVTLLRTLTNSPAVLTAVNNLSISSHIKDSDDDDLNDFLEMARHTDSCDNDSDDDGIHDGAEVHGGSNPEDGNHAQVELTATISAVTSDTVTVSSYTCTTTDATNFGGESDLSAYHVGDVVEIKCRIEDVSGTPTLVLKKIHSED